MSLTAREFVLLKEQIKAELERRSGCGPVNQFTTSSYDFQNVPEAGGVILQEQGDKIITPVLTVTDISGLKYPQIGEYVPTALEDLNSIVTQWSNEQAIPNGSTSCRGACTGLCVNTCYAGASGCVDCDTACSNTCGGCAHSCTESCGHNCSATCGFSCTGYCYGSCTAGCRTACTGCSGGSS